MCLTNFEKIKATEPITVYKVLVKSADGYVSPFHSYLWEEGKLKFTKEAIEILFNKEGDPIVGAGVFHSYKSIEDAIYHLRGFQIGSRYLTYAIGKFKIPAGAEVYVGECGYGELSYASASIRFDGIVNVEDEDNTAVLLYAPVVFNHGRRWPQTLEDAERLTEAERNSIKNAVFTDGFKELMLSKLEEIKKNYYKFKGWI